MDGRKKEREKKREERDRVFKAAVSQIHTHLNAAKRNKMQHQKQGRLFSAR